MLAGEWRLRQEEGAIAKTQWRHSCRLRYPLPLFLPKCSFLNVLLLASLPPARWNALPWLWDQEKWTMITRMIWVQQSPNCWLTATRHQPPFRYASSGGFHSNTTKIWIDETNLKMDDDDDAPQKRWNVAQPFIRKQGSQRCGCNHSGAWESW